MAAESADFYLFVRKLAKHAPPICLGCSKYPSELFGEVGSSVVV